MNNARFLVVLALVVSLAVSATACRPAMQARTERRVGVEEYEELPVQVTRSMSMLDGMDDGGIDGLIRRYGKPSGRYLSPKVPGYEAPCDWFLDVDAKVRYTLWPAVDSRGREVLLGHYAEVLEASAVVDPAFVGRLVDGETCYKAATDELLALNLFAEKSSHDSAPTPILVPTYLWLLDDGSGFFVVNYPELPKSQRDLFAAPEDEGDPGADAEWWPASHVTTTTKEYFYN